MAQVLAIDWFENGKIMSLHLKYEEKLEGKCPDDFIRKVFPDKEYGDDIKLLQCIGKKDIHEKKVFQGYIVKVKNIIYTDCWRDEIDRTEEYIGEIVWHQYAWHIAEKIENGIRYHSLWLWNVKDDEDDPDSDSMEIIGNRWDNPEMAVK